MLVAIDKIIIKDRIRKDFGDIAELAQDIKENGLINPPVVIPEKDGTFTLLAGERRVRALKSLGKTDIEVRTWKALTAEEKLNVEISENEVRKEFSKAERVEYGRRLERIEREKAKERMSEGGKGVQSFAQVDDSGKTRDAVAEQLGIGSGEQYRKEKTIVDNRNLISAEDFANWDEGKLSTNKAYQRVKAELERQKAKVAELENQPVKTVVKEVVPDDYRQVKAEVGTLRSEYESMSAKWRQSEAERKRLLAEKADPEIQQEENVTRGMLQFNAMIANFLENAGGYVWLTEYMDYAKNDARKGFLSGINALDAWVQILKENLGGNYNE